MHHHSHPIPHLHINAFWPRASPLAASAAAAESVACAGVDELCRSHARANCHLGDSSRFVPADNDADATYKASPLPPLMRIAHSAAFNRSAAAAPAGTAAATAHATTSVFS